MAIQNIRIKYVTDTGDLAKADVALGKLTDSEKKLQKEFDGANSAMKKNFKETEKEADNLNRTLKGLGGAVAGYFAVSNVISFGKEIINIRGEFQKLEAVLTNTLGDSGLAKTALNNIKNFAATTNYSVLELTNAFVKLANRGFVPTIEEMRRLGDVANSTGKTFDQLAEAILDAGTFEFERMKEFGIKMKKHGDMISASFKGITTEIKASEDSINQYILSLGDLEGVAGSTEAISQTLAGQMSNLGDAYDSMLNSWGISWQGFFSGILNGVKLSFDGIRWLIKSNKEAFEEMKEDSFSKMTELDKDALSTLEEMYTFSGVEKTQVRKKALAQLKLDLMMNQADLIQQGKDFTSNEYVEYTRRIQNIEKIQDDERKLEEQNLEDLKKSNAKKTEENKKARDNEYQEALSLLAKQEALAKREADLNTLPLNELIGIKDTSEEDTLQKLQVEEDYTIKRINLYQKYGQKDIEERKSLDLKLREIQKERSLFLTTLVKTDAEMNKSVEDKALEDAKKRAEEAEKTDEELNEAFRKNANETLENDKRTQAEKKAFAMQVAGEMMQGISMIYNEFKANSDATRQIEQDENRQRENAELEAVKGNKQAEANIKAKYDAIERKAKYDQAKANKEQAMFNIGLSTAEAVMRAIGTPPAPNFVLGGIAAGFGLVQLGIVASRPLPKYAKGVEMLSGEGTETSDSILAQLSKGERVVTARENRDYYPALTAIHNRQIPAEVLNGFVKNGETGGKVSVFVQQDATLASEIKGMRKDLSKLKQVNINLDKNGVNAFVKSEFGKTEYANSYVSL